MFNTSETFNYRKPQTLNMWDIQIPSDCSHCAQCNKQFYWKHYGKIHCTRTCSIPIWTLFLKPFGNSIPFLEHYYTSCHIYVHVHFFFFLKLHSILIKLKIYNVPDIRVFFWHITKFAKWGKCVSFYLCQSFFCNFKSLILQTILDIIKIWKYDHHKNY